MNAVESQEWLDKPSYKLEHGVALTLHLLGEHGQRVGNFEHLIDLSHNLEARQVDLVVVLDQGIDTSTAVGRMFFQILGPIPEFEHALMSERTRDGLAAARARGRKGGPKPKLRSRQIALAQQMYDELGPVVAIRITAHRDHIEIAVTDDNPGVAVVQAPDPDRLGSRGLAIVAALAERWGQHPPTGPRKKFGATWPSPPAWSSPPAAPSERSLRSSRHAVQQAARLAANKIDAGEEDRAGGPGVAEKRRVLSAQADHCSSPSGHLPSTSWAPLPWAGP